MVSLPRSWWACPRFGRWAMSPGREAGSDRRSSPGRAGCSVKLNGRGLGRDRNSQGKSSIWKASTKLCSMLYASGRRPCS